jgi:hypothetical protein
MNVESLLTKLHGRGGFEVVNDKATDTQVRLMGRVPKPAMAGWLIIVQRLLVRANKVPSWSVDISKQYFLRNDQVVFGWRLIFQGQELAAQLGDIEQTIINAPRARAFVDEQVLAGAHPERNAPGASGKGAQGVLKAAVGPQAVAQAQFLAGRT